MKGRMAEVTEDFPRPEYPNSPLEAVVFEIRFPGEPAIECHRDQFFTDARNEYPRVFVPTVRAGTASALSPYKFQREDESSSLMTAMNLFAYQTTEYPGYARFRHEALKWVRVFGSRFNLARLNRTGLRYTNIIRYTPGEQFPVTSYLDVAVRLGVVESANFERFSLSAVIPTASGGMLTVQIREVVSDTDEPAILLDFDYALQGVDLHIDNVEKYLDDSHAETKRLFEGLLTPTYRSFIRGEGLE
jgi:uncharacterized protein (TIGR04255 family)